MDFFFTPLQIEMDDMSSEVAAKLKALKGQIINGHREDILRTIEEQCGSREVRFVFGLAGIGSETPSKHNITPKMSAAIQEQLQEFGCTAYVQTVESALTEAYSIPRGSCDVEEGCKATWKLSKIPLYIEICYDFEDDGSSWSIHFTVDGIEDRKNLSKSAVEALPLVKRIRKNYENTIEGIAREAVRECILAKDSKEEWLETMRTIAIGERREKVKKRTEVQYEDLLALKEDPLDDFVRWWHRFHDLATGFNMVDIDPSLFENLDSMMQSRFDTWSKRIKNKRKKQEQKRRRQQAALTDNHTAAADQHDNATADETSHDTAAADEPARDTATADEPSHDAIAADQPDYNAVDAGQPDVNTADAEQLIDVPADEMVQPEEATGLPTHGPTPAAPASAAPPQARSSDELEDMSDDEAMLEPHDLVSTPKRSSTPQPGAYQAWAIDGAWFYCEDMSKVDPVLFFSGRPPFIDQKPLLPDPSVRPQNPLPVFVRRGRVTGKVPKIEHDPIWNRMIVTPHTEVAPHDMRELTFHPDWLPKWKLQEYQAVEMAAVEVWRHDRAKLKCTLPTCDYLCSDYYESTQLCLGCGPQTSVRYCSKEHLRQDLAGHWDECGHAGFALPYWVDKGTQPAKFQRRYPAIRDINVMLGFEKLRQRAYYIWNRGQYTMFYGGGRGPTVVTWPTVELQNKFGPHVERCMNAAFYDQNLTAVIEHLYYLVRMALRLSGHWKPQTEKRLKQQLHDEFDLDTSKSLDEDPCECVWSGLEANTDHCTPECAELFARLNLDQPRAGIKAILEKLEAKSWVLRAWQRQHPTITNWRIRMSGAGFPGARVHDLDKERPLMGRLWDGAGAPDVCDGWEDIF